MASHSQDVRSSRLRSLSVATGTPTDAGFERRGVLVPVLKRRRRTIRDTGLEPAPVCALVSSTVVGSRRAVSSRTRWCTVLAGGSRLKINVSREVV